MDGQRRLGEALERAFIIEKEWTIWQKAENQKTRIQEKLVQGNEELPALEAQADQAKEQEAEAEACYKKAIQKEGNVCRAVEAACKAFEAQEAARREILACKEKLEEINGQRKNKQTEKENLATTAGGSECRAGAAFRSRGTVPQSGGAEKTAGGAGTAVTGVGTGRR